MKCLESFKTFYKVSWSWSCLALKATVLVLRAGVLVLRVDVFVLVFRVSILCPSLVLCDIKKLEVSKIYICKYTPKQYEQCDTVSTTLYQLLYQRYKYQLLLYNYCINDKSINTLNCVAIRNQLILII